MTIKLVIRIIHRPLAHPPKAKAGTVLRASGALHVCQLTTIVSHMEQTILTV